MYAIGMMSGTSLDGIDVCLVQIDQKNGNYQYEVTSFMMMPYTALQKQKILEASLLATSNVQKICSLNFEIGQWYVEAIHALLQSAKVSIDDISFIAIHGQTLWHNPNGLDGYASSTLQIGEPSVISYHFNKPVISNFRVMDIAAGGCGAPLIPFVGYMLYHNSFENIALQNVGGIGNVSFIRKNSFPSDVIAFDTGPGNMLIDGAMEYLFQQPYDDKGQTALKGHMITTILEEMLQDEYLTLPYPKSTGREKYNAAYLQTWIGKMQGLGATNEDIIATFTAYTAASIINSYHQFLPKIDRVIIMGGGAHNECLLNLLRQAFTCPVEVAKHMDAFEALGFAILGHCTLLGIPANIPAVTGAKEAVILGMVTYPPRNRKE